MLLTPTMLGSLIAGVACWLLFWYGISHVDSIPYLNQYLSRKMIMDWIRKNPPLALIITELINVGMHGLDLIKKWVGHTSLKTLSRYTHFPTEYRRKVVSELAKNG